MHMKMRVFFSIMAVLLSLTLAACNSTASVDQNGANFTTQNTSTTVSGSLNADTTTQNNEVNTVSSTTLSDQLAATTTTDSDSVNVEDLLPAPNDKNTTKNPAGNTAGNPTTSTTTATNSTTLSNQQTTTKPSSNTSKTTDKWNDMTVETDTGWSPIV